MKVVGLISGGKDSIFNLMKCVKHGHEIVAVANLNPTNQDVQELDSFMYQTVGHNIVESVAKCLNVPLFRRSISGSAVTTELDYIPTQGDEVEDMFLLLKDVQDKFPDVKGVSSGAVFSRYQKHRVENVCDRLGLTSLSYLWEMDQEVLLDQMKEEGLEAVLIKVACIGLDPHKHLGHSVHELRSHLSNINKKYGVNVAGEGGEYESLTLDCPLFKTHRLEFDMNLAEIVSEADSDSVVNVGHLIIHDIHVVPK